MTSRSIVIVLSGVLAVSFLMGTARASVLSVAEDAASADARQLDEPLLAEILSGQLLPQDLSPSDLGIFAPLINVALFPIVDDFQFTPIDLSAQTLALMTVLPPSFDEASAPALAVASHSPQRTGSIRLLASTFSHQIGMAIWGLVGAICVAAGCAGPGAPRWTAINTYRIYRAMGLALPEQLFGRPQRELAPVELPANRISAPVES